MKCYCALNSLKIHLTCFQNCSMTTLYIIWCVIIQLMTKVYILSCLMPFLPYMNKKRANGPISLFLYFRNGIKQDRIYAEVIICYWRRVLVQNSAHLRSYLIMNCFRCPLITNNDLGKYSILFYAIPKNIGIMKSGRWPSSYLYMLGRA